MGFVKAEGFHTLLPLGLTLETVLVRDLCFRAAEMCWHAFLRFLLAGGNGMAGFSWSEFQVNQGCFPFVFINCKNSIILKFNTLVLCAF